MAAIKPLKRYACPSYPTIDEIGQVDLSAVPARWMHLKAVVASLGTVALTMKAFAQDAAPVVLVTAIAPQPKTTVSNKPAVAVEKNPVTDVSPLLPIAVAGEGRGGFGCVAVNPPVILSEGEALEIIEREFAKRGIALVDCPEIDHVELPSRPGKRRPVMLDLGTATGDLFIEFISVNDVDAWKKPEKVTSWSTLETFDVRAAAANAVTALSARRTGKPVSVGIRYDPITYLPHDWKPEEPKEGEKSDRKDPWKVWQSAGRALAEKKLKAQLEGLFAHLEKQGKLSPAK